VRRRHLFRNVTAFLGAGTTMVFLVHFAGLAWWPHSVVTGGFLGALVVLVPLKELDTIEAVMRDEESDTF